ncbi:Retrovirus-related Pol polyprotein from type-1 retrotransposable element R1 [Halotydeus destructor]|nr:Retrovirus-related Pol polyprotein from type-1 retrotransposable element R1 [Halotydeus destructor]
MATQKDVRKDSLEPGISESMSMKDFAKANVMKHVSKISKAISMYEAINVPSVTSNSVKSVLQESVSALRSVATFLNTLESKLDEDQETDIISDLKLHMRDIISEEMGKLRLEPVMSTYADITKSTNLKSKQSNDTPKHILRIKSKNAAVTSKDLRETIKENITITDAIQIEQMRCNSDSVTVSCESSASKTALLEALKVKASELDIDVEDRQLQRRNPCVIVTNIPGDVEDNESKEDAINVNKLSFFQLNANRSFTALLNIRDLALESRIDFILITEPYLNSRGLPPNLSGYEAIFVHLIGIKIRSVTYVSNQTMSYSYTLAASLSTPDVIVLDLQLGRVSLTVVNEYCDVKLPLEHSTRKLRSIGLSKKNVIYGADANAWSTLWGSAFTNARGQQFNEFIVGSEFDLLNYKCATFEREYLGSIRKSSLDITLLQNSGDFHLSKWNIEDTASFSDHKIVSYQLTLNECTSRRIAPVTRIDPSKLSLELKMKTLNLKEALAHHDPNRAVDAFNVVMSTAIASSSTTMKPRRFWADRDLKAGRKHVRKIEHKLASAGSQIRQLRLRQQLTAARTELKSLILSKHGDAWKKRLSKLQLRDPWKLYKLISSTPFSTIRQLTTPNGMVEEPRHIAETLLNEFFQFTLDITALYSKEHIPFEAIDVITEEEVLSKLRSFRPKKAPGVDMVTPEILVLLGELILPEMTSLYNKCFHEGIFPTAWKNANVVTIRKPGKDDYTSPRSFRPIGLLSFLGKTLEKLISDRIQNHIHDRLSQRQHGFTFGKSTHTALKTILDRAHRNRQAKKITCIIALDIVGAFDNAKWSDILNSLEQKSVPYYLYAIMSSYLEDRTVTMKFNGGFSKKYLTKGCTQGSVLGPLLWNLIADNLLQMEGWCASNDVIAYADDLTIVISGDDLASIEISASAAMCRVAKWASKHGLEICPKKSKYLIIKKTRARCEENIVIQMEDHELAVCNSLKLLGMVIDDNLSFRPHWEAVKSKVLKKCLLMKKLPRHTIPISTKILFYKGAILPIILYGASLTSPRGLSLQAISKISSFKAIVRRTKDKMTSYLQLLFMFNGIPLLPSSDIRQKCLQVIFLVLTLSHSLLQFAQHAGFILSFGFKNPYACMSVFKYGVFILGRLYFIRQRNQLDGMFDTIRNFKIIDTQSRRTMERRYFFGWVLGFVGLMVAVTTYWSCLGTVLFFRFKISDICDPEKAGAILSAILAVTFSAMHALSNSWPVCFMAVNMFYLACLSEIRKSLMKQLSYQIKSQRVNLQYCESRWMYATKTKEQLNQVMAPHFFYLAIHLFSNIVTMGSALKTSASGGRARLAHFTLGYEAAMCTIHFVCLGILIRMNHRFNLKARDDLDDVTENFYETMNRKATDKSRNGHLAEFLEWLAVDAMNNISLFSLSVIDMNFIVQFGAALVPLATLFNQLYEAKQDSAKS